MKTVMNEEVGMEISIPDSFASLGEEYNDLLKLVECYYQDQYLGSDGIAEFLGDHADERTIANLINGLERLIKMNNQLKHALAWLVVDVVYLLYQRIKASNPDMSEQDIYERLYNYIGPDSFLYVSENTIYQYVRLAEYFPPDKREPGMTVSFCLESVVLSRSAMRSGSKVDTRADESLRERLHEIVSDVVSQGDTSRIALSDRIHREIGGLEYPLFVVDGGHHRIIMAVSSLGDIDLPIEGSWTAKRLMKMLHAFLASWLDPSDPSADMKITLRTEGKVLEFEARVSVDPSGKFPVLEVKHYDEIIL